MNDIVKELTEIKNKISSNYEFIDINRDVEYKLNDIIEELGTVKNRVKVEHKRDLFRTLTELSTAISNFSNIVEHYEIEDIKRAIFDNGSGLTPYQKSTIYYIVFTLYHPAPDTNI